MVNRSPVIWYTPMAVCPAAGPSVMMTSMVLGTAFDSAVKVPGPRRLPVFQEGHTSALEDVSQPASSLGGEKAASDLHPDGLPRALQLRHIFVHTAPSGSGPVIASSIWMI
jgi:hypothetical protein